jgi:membrane protein implicated in regulation of membrane protease activity
MTAYLPAHRHSADCDCYAADLTAYREQQPQQIVHIHEAAAPDRTIQRVALGSGMGAGAVAAGVYFGPLLVAALASMAITLAVLALVVAVSAWAVVAVVRSVGGTDGKAAAKAVRRRR